MLGRLPQSAGYQLEDCPDSTIYSSIEELVRTSPEGSQSYQPVGRFLLANQLQDLSLSPNASSEARRVKSKTLLR